MITRDTFSARWTGLVAPEFSETYTFHVAADDGVRLWIGKQLIINSWTTGSRELSGQITLQKGKNYEVKMEYFESTGNATAQLRWSSPSTAKQVVPSTALFPEIPSSTTSIETTADTYVRGGAHANTNFGTAQDLIVKYAGTADNRRETYLRFDVSSLGSSFSSAKLQVVGKLTGAMSGGINVALIEAASAGWSEGGLTWNNRPAAIGSVIDSKTIAGTAAQVYEYDITSWLKAARSAGKTSVALILRTTFTTDPQVSFASRESGNGAKIVVS